MTLPVVTKGFTLLEVLIALFIATLTFVAFFSAITQMIGNQHQMERQTQATWVASNIMALQTTGLNAYEPFKSTSGSMPMGKQVFEWQVKVLPTDDANIARVVVTIYEQDTKILSLTGYRNLS